MVVTLLSALVGDLILLPSLMLHVELVTLWDLAAYTSSGPAHLNWRNHGENLGQRLDRLIGSGLMDPRTRRSGAAAYTGARTM